MRRGQVIRVLGPIDVATPEGVRSIGSRHQRAVVAALVVAAGHAIAADQLEAVVWGEHPPESAHAALQTYVSRLRHLLGADAVEHADHTYRLVVERDQIDALRFEDLLLRATEVRDDPGRCAPLCREALGCWRGSPFGDLGDDEPFRLETLRLEELRLATMELSLECELAGGRREVALAELESAVEEHPHRERLWHLLIDALVRDDRRVDALRACTRLREVLADVGLGPGEELLHLEARILSDGTATPSSA